MLSTVSIFYLYVGVTYVDFERVEVRSPGRFVALGGAHIVGVAVPAYLGLSVGFIRAKVNLNCVRRGDV